MKALEGVDVVVLAGGLGTRLRSVINEGQKVVAEVQGVPFIDFILEPIIKAGAKRIIFALGYKSDQVIACLKKHRKTEVEFIFSLETHPLGTGGALRLTLPYIFSKYVLALNGDSFIEVDYDRLLSVHKDKNARATLSTTHMDDVGRYGVVKIKPEGQVIAFDEKTNSTSGGYVNAGVYMFNRSTIEEIPADEIVSLEYDFFPLYINNGLYAVQQDAPFIDIGTPADYGRAANFFNG